jgi:FKBP-type peptidyl-prolyl cis-trans isomerase
MKRITWFFLLIVFAVACNKTTVTLTAEEQLIYDVNLIDEYLAQNGINAIKLENGIRYFLEVTGTGPTPTKDNCFTVKYRGIVLHEEEAFGDSGDGTYSNPVKSQIPGFQIMLKLMPVGSKGTVFIPSVLGYGVNGNPQAGIPSNAVLKFDLELLAIHPYNALGNYCNQ